MTPRETDAHAQERCPTCVQLGNKEQEAAEGWDRSGLLDVKILRKDHASSGACLSAVGVE